MLQWIGRKQNRWQNRRRSCRKKQIRPDPFLLNICCAPIAAEGSYPVVRTAGIAREDLRQRITSTYNQSPSARNPKSRKNQRKDIWFALTAAEHNYPVAWTAGIAKEYLRNRITNTNKRTGAVLLSCPVSRKRCQ